jgi:C-terminal processing protease CtpA/Prc
LIAESINKTTAYLRPGAFSLSEIGEIGEQLDSLSKAGATTLILDLRVPTPEATFQNAAQFLNHFCPPNQLLFKIQKPGEERPTLFQSRAATAWDGDLILLVDSQTPPASEAIATVLKRMRNPVIIGTPTPGQTVEYEKIIIGDEAFLRFAVAEVIFADDSSIFRKGIKPDLEAQFEIADKAYIFDASHDQGMKPFLFSNPQPRLNEAALVAGTNPELDYAIAKSAGRDTGYDTIPIHDRVVQAALDYLVTTDLLGEP